MKPPQSLAYRNAFLYFVVRVDERRGDTALIVCSGINAVRFSPITKGRHGIGNPSVRGLQLVNLGIRDLALKRGATPRALRENVCAGLAPAEDTWYTERLLIEGASAPFSREIIDYSVMNLLKKIFNACMLEVQLPEEVPTQEELQDFLEALCRKYGAPSDR
jgi:hypothetical protein